MKTFKQFCQTEGIRRILRLKHSGHLTTDQETTHKKKVERRLKSINPSGSLKDTMRHGAIKSQLTVLR